MVLILNKKTNTTCVEIYKGKMTTNC